MRFLVVAFALHLFSALPAMADTPPAILGNIDITNIQPLDNPEDIRGEYFRVNTDLPDYLSNVVMEVNVKIFCIFNNCTGRLAPLVSYGAAWVGVEYLAPGSNAKQWKSY